MGRLIDVDEVKKLYPIMENDFGMVINDRLHENLDKIPTVNTVSEEVYTEEYNLRKDAELKVYKLEKAIDEIKAEINTKIQAHSSPKDDVFFCLDYAYRVIDEKVKEYTE